MERVGAVRRAEQLLEVPWNLRHRQERENTSAVIIDNQHGEIDGIVAPGDQQPIEVMEKREVSAQTPRSAGREETATPNAEDRVPSIPFTPRLE